MLQTIIVAAFTALLTSLATFPLAERRLKREFQLHFQAETILRKLLNHPDWELRSFEAIKHHMGGFSDEELRRLLVQAGALRFQDKEGAEMWGLLDRTSFMLEAKGDYKEMLLERGFRRSLGR